MTIYTSIIAGVLHFARTDKGTMDALRIMRNASGTKPTRVATLADGWIPTSTGIARTYDAWANQPDVIARREHYPSRAAPDKAPAFTQEQLLALLG